MPPIASSPSPSAGRTGDARLLLGASAPEFYKLHDAGVSQTATWTIARMADCGPSNRKSEVTTHKPARRRRHTSAPIVAELQARWESELTRISGKSKLAEAIRYGLSRKAEFRRIPRRWARRTRQTTASNARSDADDYSKNALFAGSKPRRDMGDDRLSACDCAPQ